MVFNISDIARKTGIQKINIKEIVSGRKYPSETALRNIAEVVGVTPDELLQEIQSRTIKKESLLPIQNNQ